jgi:hypothetical protein
MAQSNNVYLMRKLALFGVEGLPGGAIRELVSDALLVSRAFGKQTGETARSNLLRMLDGQAANVAALINGSRDAAGKPIVDEKTRGELVAILARHGVDIPSPVDDVEQARR